MKVVCYIGSDEQRRKMGPREERLAQRARSKNIFSISNFQAVARNRKEGRGWRWERWPERGKERQRLIDVVTC